ncbi:MAG: tail fiber domain-containing protein [Candidatus Udaeobacter sp.]
MKTSIPTVLITFTLVCFALVRNTQAVSPPPDGGYLQGSTAEGTDALFSLTFGAWNTALGYQAQYKNASANQNTATGYQTLFSNDFSNKNTAYGAQALYHHFLGDFNTATGFRALYTDTEGIANTGDGFEALAFNDLGRENTASGYMALYHNTGGSLNIAVGFQALFQNTTGGLNIALGSGAGTNLTTGDNNIDIGNPGVAGEANAVRLGTQGTQTETFIAGISGTAVSGIAVVVNGNGQLGVAPSSERFKDEIRPMNKASEAILALKPVTFRYKKEIDAERAPQFGLVAEEVAKVNPSLVVRDKSGEIYTVRYDQVNAMLLNEFLKEHRTVQEQGATITQLKSMVEKQEAANAQQQKQIEALTTGLQKVSAQLEASKPAPQVVNNP